MERIDPVPPSVKAIDLSQWIGRKVQSPWLVIDQDMIDRFAEATGDRTWIHVDVARAEREMGGTIAHGFLSLSLLSRLSEATLRVIGYTNAMNYGFDKLRFTAPVTSGRQVRLDMGIAAVTSHKGGLLVRRACMLELRGSARPALVTDWLTLIYPDA
jgi:acyl dehydratase